MTTLDKGDFSWLLLRLVSKECVLVRMFWLFEQQQRQGKDCMPGWTLTLRRKYSKNNWQFCLDNIIQQQWGKKNSYFSPDSLSPQENRIAGQLPVCAKRVAWPFIAPAQKTVWHVLVPFYSIVGPALQGTLTTPTLTTDDVFRKKTWCRV